MTEVNVREEIGHLRRDIDRLVTQAASAGIRPAEVARQAGVSGSYLSQLRRVATYPGKAPTPAALSRIVRALRFVTDEHASNLRLAGPATVRSIHDRLRRLDNRRHWSFSFVGRHFRSRLLAMSQGRSIES